MHEQVPAVSEQIIRPRPVGNVALSGAVGRVSIADSEPQVVVRDHRQEPKKPTVPDLLAGGLSPENQTWLTEQRQKEKDWRRRVAAARYASGETDVPAPYRG